MRVALDTNVLVYAEGVNGVQRHGQALELIRSLPHGRVRIPVQVLGELFNVLVRKAGRQRSEARERVLSWKDAFGTADTTSQVLFGASDLAVDHRLGIWDAVILNATASSGCRVLLSEDLSEGFTWHGVTVVNPFAETRHPLLSALLEGDRTV
ncbi:MAG TPA: PIN domain-containing protein [Trueperaceae bacterium]|nr:PIN domain-containing protein [Trueperaceae bacterium]